MKKTLERLRKKAQRNIEFYLKIHSELLEKFNEPGKTLARYSLTAVDSCYTYIRALEDYYLELDKEWDKLLKSIEQARVAQKKEEGKKPSYRV